MDKKEPALNFMALSYTDAGVDIDAGNALIEKIKPLANATKRAGVMENLGGFGALFDLGATKYQDPILVSTTDGVGTKLKIALEVGIFDTIGIDLVAMCVNDLICQGADPLFFLDYFASAHLDVARATRIIEGISKACRHTNMALIGGETAEMPGLYQGEDFDLAGFCVGAVERTKILPQNITEGDIVIGFASSGVHSNGFSLVRHVIERANLRWDQPAPFAPEQNLGAAFLTPTKLYVKAALAGLNAKGVRGYAHITGGGLAENLHRILPSNLRAKITPNSWALPPIFSWLAQTGNITSTEMSRSFNMGIGFVSVVAPEEKDTLVEIWQNLGEKTFEIGIIKHAP